MNNIISIKKRNDKDKAIKDAIFAFSGGQKSVLIKGRNKNDTTFEPKYGRAPSYSPRITDRCASISVLASIVCVTSLFVINGVKQMPSPINTNI